MSTIELNTFIMIKIEVLGLILLSKGQFRVFSDFGETSEILIEFNTAEYLKNLSNLLIKFTKIKLYENLIKAR